MGLAEARRRCPARRRAPRCRPSPAPSAATTGSSPHARAGCQAATSSPTARATSKEPSSRATCTVAPASSPSSSAGAASTSWVRATTNSAQRAGLIASRRAGRGGPGAAGMPRIARGQVGHRLGLAHPDHPVQGRELLGPGRAGAGSRARWASMALVVEARAPRRRAGPRAPRGSCRIAWRGRSPDWAGWFPAGQTGPWTWDDGRADPAGPRRRRRRPGGHHGLRPPHAARGVAGVRPPRRPGRRRRPHPGGVPPGPAGAGRVPGRVVGAHLAAPDRPLRVRRPRARPHPAPVAARPARAARGHRPAASRPSAPASSTSTTSSPASTATAGRPSCSPRSRGSPTRRRRWCARCRSARSARGSPGPRADLLDGLIDEPGGRLRRRSASSSASWTWPLVPTPLPPSMPSRAGEVGEAAAGLGEDHRHRTDVVGLHDRVDHRGGPAGGHERVAVAVAPGAQHRTGGVERGRRRPAASG